VGDPVSFLIAFGLGLVLMPLARRAGPGLGLVDRPAAPPRAGPASAEGLKIHSTAISVLGGTAVVLAALAGPAVLGHRPSVWIALAAIIGLAVGLVDDARTLPPLVRALGLAVAGTALGVGLLRAGYGVEWMAVAIALSLACSNGVNLLDGQDGLVGGVGLAGTLGLAALVPALGIRGPAAVGGGTDLPLALGGALLAFLLWNRPPARLFLGNGGAYAVGILLAGPALSLLVAHGWRGVLAAGTCLGVVAFELVTTLVRRTRSRAAVTAGDRSHSYDVVAGRVGRTQSTLIFWAVGAAAMGLCLLVATVSIGIAIAIAGTMAAAAGLAALSLWNRSVE
jgi:UDP-GlcNAc:undecaprenyl-phosphate GlcNAc-1-phosphate transferase